MRNVLLVLLLLGLGHPLRGQELTEALTGVSFPMTRSFLDRGQRNLSAVATAVRNREGFRFYTLCLYVDLKDLRARARGHAKDPEALGQLLAGGGIRHAFVTRFYAGVAGQRRLAFLTQNVQRSWPGFHPEDPEYGDFLQFIQEDIQRGDTTEIWIGQDGSMYGRRGGGPPRRSSSPALARAFTATYFGDKAMDGALKKILLEGLVRALD